MSEKHTVAVVAATGAQGRSVALHFLKSPERYSVRALVRNTSSDVATQLKQKGAELHTATLDDTSALQRAFRGAEAVFAYTAPQTWGAPDPSKPNETQLGKNIVDACGKEGVKWLAWTSCPSAEKYSNGAMSIPTYEEKRAVDEYIRETKTPGTILMLGGFLENVLNFGWLKKDAQSDTLALNTPLLDASLPQAWTSVSHDLGPIVETVFSNALGWSGRKANPTKWQHREVNTCFGWPSTGELKDAIAQQNNRPVQQNVASKEVLLKVAPHLAGALPIFELIRDYNTMPDPKDPFKRVQLPDQALTEEGLKLDTPQRWAKEDVGAFLDSGA